MKHFRWDKKYLYWGVTAFCVFVASLLVYLLLVHLPGVHSALKTVLSILSPFIWGIVIAYLLYPLMRILHQSVFRRLFGRLGKTGEKSERAARVLAVLVAELTLIVVLVTMVWLIAPRLYQSLESIVLNSGSYVNKAYAWIDRLLVDYPEVEEAITSTFGNLSDGLFSWLRNSILPQMSNVLTNVASGVIYFVRGIYNLIIGIIVSVYLLYNKESFAGKAKKLLYSIFSVEASERILSAIGFIDKVFMGFLSGKLLDSIIIGVICYVACLIMRMPYALLVSVIVGLTNIIPFFGPFIGAIPSAIIILMESPLKALIFLIFILVLQQFDGNFLGPKILGNSVGINGFWVMFSIILGSGLFGFAGMLLGVPVFVVLYTGISRLINRKLKRSGLPVEEDFYTNLQYIDPETGEGVYREDRRRRIRNMKNGDGKAVSAEKNEKKEAVSDEEQV